MSGKRHVLFLIPTLASGGAERVVVTILRHLDRSRFRLALGVVDVRHPVFMSDVPKDVEFVNLGSHRVRHALPKIIALLWKMQPDVVFSTLGHLNLSLAILRPLLPSRPRYIARETMIVSEGIRDYRHPDLWAWAYRRYYWKHDAVVCQSRYMYTDLIQNFAVPESKAVVITNPVDVEHIRRKANDRVTYRLDADWEKSIKLVAIGRLSEVKGYDMLLRALALLPNEAIQLAILGEGELLGQLQRQAAQLGISHRVHFAGFQVNPYAWLARADALVLSSRHEAFPNVVLEALACGTPVVAVPAPGGTQEILKNIRGCALAKDLTDTSLAEAIQGWASGDRGRIGEEAISPYRVEKIVHAYENLLLA